MQNHKIEQIKATLSETGIQIRPHEGITHALARTVRLSESEKKQFSTELASLAREVFIVPARYPEKTRTPDFVMAGDVVRLAVPPVPSSLHMASRVNPSDTIHPDFTPGRDTPSSIEKHISKWSQGEEKELTKAGFKYDVYKDCYTKTDHGHTLLISKNQDSHIEYKKDGVSVIAKHLERGAMGSWIDAGKSLLGMSPDIDVYLPLVYRLEQQVKEAQSIRPIRKASSLEGLS